MKYFKLLPTDITINNNLIIWKQWQKGINTISNLLDLENKFDIKFKMKCIHLGNAQNDSRVPNTWK